MYTKFLLPHKFKKLGAWFFPVGILGWTAIQKGVLTNILRLLYGDTNEANLNPTAEYITANVVALFCSYFLGLFGFYFLTFSREKKEDEYVQKKRLDSFQLAAFLQISLFIVAFLLMPFTESYFKTDKILPLVLLLLIFGFWITYIFSFNYSLHWKHKLWKTK